MRLFSYFCMIPWNEPGSKDAHSMWKKEGSLCLFLPGSCRSRYVKSKGQNTITLQLENLLSSASSNIMIERLGEI